MKNILLSVKQINLKKLLLYAIFSFLFFYFFLSAIYPGPIGFGEDITAFSVKNLLAAKDLKSIYPQIEESGFFIQTYPPVYFALNGALCFMFNSENYYFFGRLISILSALFSSLLIYKIVKDQTKENCFSFASIVVFLFSSLVLLWSIFGRVDFLALFFTSLALYIFIKNKNNVFFTAVFLILAFFTKQTFISLPLAFSFWLFFNDKKLFLKFIAYFLALFCAFFAAGNLATNNGFYLNLVFNLANHAYAFLPDLNTLAKKIFFSWPYNIAAPITVYLYFKQEKSGLKNFLALYFFISLFSALFFFGKEGASTNYFIEPILPLSILFALVLKDQKSVKRFLWDIKNTAAEKFFLSLLLLSIILNIGFYCENIIYYYSTYPKYYQYLSYIKNTKGEFFDSSYAYSDLAEYGSVVVDAFNYKQLAQKGLIDETLLINKIKNKELKLVVLYNPFEQNSRNQIISSQTFSAVQKNYSLKDSWALIYVYFPNK